MGGQIVNQKLKDQFPNLFNIVQRKHATVVAEVLSSNPLNVSFRRALVGDKLTEWYCLVASLLHINLNEGMDCLFGIYIKVGHSQLIQCIGT